MTVGDLLNCYITNKYDNYFYNGDRLTREELEPYLKEKVQFFELCGKIDDRFEVEIIRYSLHIYTASLGLRF